MPRKAKTLEFPAITEGGAGVAPLVIPEVAKAVSKYEKKKEARCNASPGEIAAKAELKELLHAHRDKLPMNDDGNPYYRHEGADYVLEEKLKRVSTDKGDGGEE